VPETVIEATGFSASAHKSGIVLSVIVDKAVAANIRLSDHGMVWMLSKALHEAQRAQDVLERKRQMQAKLG
jgi:hypothetical protein